MDGTKVCKALAHPERRKLLTRLADGECDVKGLMGSCTLSQPTASKHLAVLREAGLVTVRADGKRRCYSIADRRVLEILALLEELER